MASREKSVVNLIDEIIETPEVHFEVYNKAGVITLQRPQALNALSVAMMKAIRRQLLRWAMDPKVGLVIVHSTCERAFCSGGDLRAVYNAGQKRDFTFLENLFREEYALNDLIRSYPKPYIAFLDGIVMGGGVGLSVHGSHRILSEKCVVAMPETNIGYFPDVGATRFLNDAPGSVGLYLGLTGASMTTADALFAHMGTHLIESKHHSYVIQELIDLDHQSLDSVNTCLQKYDVPFTSSPLEAHLEEINTLFSGPTLIKAIDNLHQASSHFAKATLKTLFQRSPTSLHITFEQLKMGKRFKSFKDIMRLEFTLSQNFVQRHDFFEGIRAAIIDKDKNPQWEPNTLEAVTQQDVAFYFQEVTSPLEFDL